MVAAMASAMRIASLPKGWRLLGWTSVALVAMVVGLTAVYGLDEAGIRVLIRATARTSFAFSLLAFAASPLRRAWRSPGSAWLLANRRYLGLSFAVSHGLHLIAIFALYHWSGRELLAGTSPLVTVVGGLGYVLLAAMAATSFDGAVALLGVRRWRLLHSVGMYYLWFVFAVSYVPRAIRTPTYLPAALLAAGALAMRIAYRPGRVRRPASAPAGPRRDVAAPGAPPPRSA
jgi:methionine sulfoxide reductase heme-binding subunit